MARMKVETVMTYEQWEKEHKKRIQKAVKDTTTQLLNDIGFAMLILAVPLCMVAHFFLSTGY